MANGGRVVVVISSKDETRQGITRARRNVDGLSQSFNKLKIAGVAAFAGLTFAIKQSVEAFADFDTRVREITTLLTELDEGTVQQLEDNIIGLAISTGQSVEDMAKANYDAISAGFNDAAQSAILLEQAARLAVGGVSDVAATTDVLTSILNSYGQSATAAAKFSDELFTIVRLGKTTIDELTSGLGRAVAIAPQLGVSFQDLGAAVATLTAAGQSTDQVVTSLTQVLSKLLSPTEALEKRLLELGFTSGRAAVEALGFAEVLKVVAENATEADLAAFFSDVRAIRAVLPLAGVQAEKFAKNVVEMGQAAGSADLAFDRMSQGIGFSLNQAGTFVDAFAIAVGKGFEPLIRDTFNLTNAFDNVEETIKRLDAVSNNIANFIANIRSAISSLTDFFSFLNFFTQPGFIGELLDVVIDRFRTFPERLEIFVLEVEVIFLKLKRAVEEGIQGLISSSIVGEFQEFIDSLFPSDISENVKEAFEGINQAFDQTETTKQIEETIKQIDELNDAIKRISDETAPQGLFDIIFGKGQVEEFFKPFTELFNIPAKVIDDAEVQKVVDIASEMERINALINEVDLGATFQALDAEELTQDIDEINQLLRESRRRVFDLGQAFIGQLGGAIAQMGDLIADSLIDSFLKADNAFTQFISSILKQATALATRLGALSLVSLIPGVGSFASLVRLAFAQGGIVPNIQGFADGGIVKNIPKMEGFQSGGIKSTDTIPAVLTPGEAVIPAQSTQNNREIIDRLISSPSPLQSTIAPVQQSSNNINVAFNGFDELSAQRILNSPEFQNTFADIINNGELKVEIEGKQLEVIK